MATADVKEGRHMRLVTRSDFDGLLCGFLLREIGLIDSWVFVHPKDLQDGNFDAMDDDVLVNVPFVPGCGLWFDHHSSELERVWVEFEGCSRVAPSCARVIYEYYGGRRRFPSRVEMVDYADRIDSADLTLEEILNPTGWILLGFLTDPRSGLGRFRDYTISNYQLMSNLLESHYKAGYEEILALPDVQERVKRYFEEDKLFREMVKERTRIEKNIIITDVRGLDVIHVGNRFLVYSLYPEQNVSLWIADVRGNVSTMISCGHSVISRTCKTDIGSLMLKYYGGGHAQVGTCQVPVEEFDDTLNDIIMQLISDEENLSPEDAIFF